MAAPITVCPKEGGITVPCGVVFSEGMPKKQRKCPKCGTLYLS